MNLGSTAASARRVLRPVARAVYRLGRAVARSIYRLVRGAVRAVFAFAGRLSSAETRPRWMNRLPGNRFALAGLVVLALVALYGVATFARPAASAPRRGTTVPVTSADAACPDTHGARVSAVTPPGAHGVGQASVTGRPVVLTSPGTAWSTDVKGKDAGPWAFGAYGSLAPGLTVEQTTSEGGLAGTRCLQPAADLWFAGPGPADAKDVGLYLTNVDDRPVTAIVAALSPEGSIETPEGEDDVLVAPHTTRLVQVGVQVEGFGRTAADARLIALHIHADNGRIAAAVRVQRKKGADWLPATVPGSSVVVPGVPSGSGKRRLLIAVPGRDEAQVRVQGIAKDGAFAPIGTRSLQAPALAVTSFDVGLGGKYAGLRLVSDKPVVAALVIEEGDDFAVTGATPPLTAEGQGGLVADVRDKTTLLLTAPGAAAGVRLTQLMGQGPAGTPQDVRVPAGRTIEVKMPPPAGGDGYGLTIVPGRGSGPVYAARVLRIKKQGVTLLPVTPARMTALLPVVRDMPLP
ncbi:DUF5719 family protein [Actinomadura sp. DC4]|uniref:DUF5719 family protein n=1 Tax=Actinomadura sp. DC4 TaxID=3055069 RepID=UPI0025B07272|nr:DUF5719 family protein [Actinomadura sp. DC4]MDN3355521.1 DUF5719 family protein [Actinomadura sp. DC4]